MFLALPRVEPGDAQSTAVPRECKCENNIVTGPSRSDVKLLIGLNRVGLCEHGNEHFGCKQSENTDKISDSTCVNMEQLCRHF